MEKVADEKIRYKLWVSIFFALLHYVAMVFLSYASSWICYQGVKKAGETIIVFFLLPMAMEIQK